jgi:hypothetical protein
MKTIAYLVVRELRHLNLEFRQYNLQ